MRMSVLEGRFMEKGKGILFGLSLSAALALPGMVLHAQTSASGQVNSPVTPGPRTNATSNCAGADGTATATASTDPNCAQTGPGFATPSTNMPLPDKAHQVTSLVRIEKVVPRPPVALPDGDTFSVVGSVTLVKIHRPALEACLASGKRISMRASAATSTTCLDHKGEVLAYQECKASAADAADCTIVNNQDIARQQLNAKVP